MEITYTMYHAVLAGTIPSITVCKSVHTMALILAMIVFTFIGCAARPLVQPEDMPLVHVPVAFIKGCSFRHVDAPTMLMVLLPLTIIELTVLGNQSSTSVILSRLEVSLV